MCALYLCLSTMSGMSGGHFCGSCGLKNLFLFLCLRSANERVVVVVNRVLNLVLVFIILELYITRARKTYLLADTLLAAALLNSIDELAQRQCDAVTVLTRQMRVTRDTGKLGEKSLCIHTTHLLGRVESRSRHLQSPHRLHSLRSSHFEMLYT